MLFLDLTIVPRIPFINLYEASVEYLLAISMASFIATLSGISSK